MSTDLEKRLEGKPNDVVALEVNRIIDEGAKSEFGDWIRIHLRQHRETALAFLERGQVADTNSVMTVLGALRAISALEGAFFSPLTIEEEKPNV